MVPSFCNETSAVFSKALRNNLLSTCIRIHTGNVQAKWLLLMIPQFAFTNKTNIGLLPDIYIEGTKVKAFLKVSQRIKNSNRRFIGIV